MVAADGPVWALLKEVLANYTRRFIPLDRAERAAVQRFDEETYLAIPAKRLAEYRRQRKVLERECGTLQLVDQTDDPLAVEQFLSLEARGWKGYNGTALASRAGHAEFFRAVCRGLAATDRLQLLALTGSRTAAMQCNFVANGTVFGFKTCYDEELSKYSPGVLLQLDALSIFQKRGIERFDSCSHAANSHLKRLLPDLRPLETIAIASPDLAGGCVIVGVSAAEKVKQGARKVLKAHPFFGSRMSVGSGVSSD
jgi:hypothetical protein